METPLAEVQQDGSRVIVDVHEREVQTDALRTLVGELRERLHESDARRFIFEFDQVEFLPSACLALLLMFYQDVKKHQGSIVLLNCQENVAFLLRLARLDVLFELAEGDAAEV